MLGQAMKNSDRRDLGARRSGSDCGSADPPSVFEPDRLHCGKIGTYLSRVPQHQARGSSAGWSRRLTLPGGLYPLKAG
jgi:hypothetical protein